MIIHVAGMGGDHPLWRVRPLPGEFPNSLILAAPAALCSVRDWRGITNGNTRAPDSETLVEGTTYDLYYLRLEDKRWFVHFHELQAHPLEFRAFGEYLKIRAFYLEPSYGKMELWLPVPSPFKVYQKGAESLTAWDRILAE